MSVISFKCPNCDGELIFDPASGAYKCEYCGSKFTQEELDAMKPAEEQEKPASSMDGSQASENTDVTQEEKKTEEEAVIYTCPSCGAQIVTDATTAATFCYYCHNPVVLPEDYPETICRIRSFRLQLTVKKQKNVLWNM